ncbi:MAG TPA: tetratricopeptide repeat-containing protein kinase family protein, partial [Polyangiaceae bacterium]|nr:tetratricopeptide repeat-containing protein kinase family protein [Polyangiaceae bacterium]
ENVLVKADGSVRLLDFGIAKQLERSAAATPAERTQGLRFMTPAYAAPEQLYGGAVGIYTDIFSLGVIAYQLLSGQLPKTTVERTFPPGPGVPVDEVPPKPSEVAGGVGGALELSRGEWADLDVLVLTAMHADPQRRYRSVDALIRDIDHFLRHEPLEARPDSWRYRLGKFTRRHRVGLRLTASIALAIVALVAFFTTRLTQARNAALAEVARTQRVERFMKRLLQGDEQQVGPADDLKVITLIDRGAREARALDGDPEVQAELFQTLGTIYGGLGRFEQAEALLGKSLERRRALFGAQSPETAEALVALGSMRQEQARWDEAEKLVREAIAIDRKTLPANHPALARAQAALGHVLVERGRYDAALPILKGAAALLQARGDQPLELRFALSDLANAQFYLGHYEESQRLNLELLALDRKTLGEEHANVADDLINLAVIQQEHGNYAESERLNRQALIITEHWFGPDHPLTASNLTSLSRALNHEGKDAEAEQLLKRALLINEH